MTMDMQISPFGNDPENPTEAAAGGAQAIGATLRAVFEFDPVLCFVVLGIIVLLVYVSWRGHFAKTIVARASEAVTLDDASRRTTRFLALRWKDSVESLSTQFRNITTASCLGLIGFAVLVYVSSQTGLKSTGTNMYLNTVKILWQTAIIVMYSSASLSYFREMRKRADELDSERNGD